MINVTFPDGAVRQYEEGTTSLEVAKSIHPGLAKRVLAAEVDGEIRDAFRPLEADANL